MTISPKQALATWSPSQYNPNRFAWFGALYSAALADVRAAEPDRWVGIDAFDSACKMLSAIRAQSIYRVCADTKSFKLVCKTLGIRHTYQAMHAYLLEGGAQPVADAVLTDRANKDPALAGLYPHKWVVAAPSGEELAWSAEAMAREFQRRYRVIAGLDPETGEPVAQTAGQIAA